MIKDYPLIGVGVDQWSEHYPLYYDKVAKDVAFNEKTRLQRVHNEYIETLASVGLIGYVFLLWALFYIVRYIAVSLTNIDNKDRSIILSSTLGMLGFAVVAFFSFPIQSYLPAFMLMFFVAIVSQLHDSPKDSVLKIKDKYYLSSFVVAILLLYSGNFVYKLLSAEHYYQKSLESYNMDDFDSGLEYVNMARELSPDVWKHNQMNAVFLMKKNRFDKAIELLKKANSISPYNIFSFFNLQESYARLGDIKKQTIVLEKILEIDSQNVKASSILVRAFYIQKKYKEATAEYKRTKKNFEYFKGRSGFGPYHTNLAETALLVGDYKYFGHIYDDLIAQDSTAENYVVYGIVEYQRTGNKIKAKELFNKAIEIDQTIDIPKEIRSDLGL
jgi:tetratricopeptide (TPR) repeat protein